jgi:hypothetical protein
VQLWTLLRYNIGMTQSQRNLFILAVTTASEECYETAADHGFHDEERSYGEELCLIHSEVSECMEDMRVGNINSNLCPFLIDAPEHAQPTDPRYVQTKPFSKAELELADVVIRCMDMAVAHGWDLANAVATKMAYNRSREYKHGGKEC